MRTKVLIAVGAVTIAAVVIAIVVLAGHDSKPVEVADGAFARPMPWQHTDGARTGVVDVANASLTVGVLSIAAPTPSGVSLKWTSESSDARQSMHGAGERGSFTWTAAAGNPHTVFSGRVGGKRSTFSEPLVGAIDLPAGELTYMNEALARVPFAGAPIQLSWLTKGPIIWRNGEDTLALWQWNADRVALLPTEGGVRVEFHWWDPALHPIAEACAKELADVDIEIEPRLTISFGEVPQFGFGRLPAGVTSAVVPVFVDPQNADDVRFRDGASGSAEDFASRARTIAFGHSSPTDARYGNGGLAGLDVGGTIVLPTGYDPESEALAALSEALKPAAVELVAESGLRPTDCGDVVKSLAEGVSFGAARTFDGKFPNIFAPDQRDTLPGVMGGWTVWQPTALTGRRKDVVTQALSATYLTRLADARGIALLEIPIVATRNPLVAVAAEALLEPERNGEWTIEESVARALAEVELLSEDERFDFIGVQRFSRYTHALGSVEIGQKSPNEWIVMNRGGELRGFTLVFDHEVEVTVDDEPVSTALRTLGNGSRQTWAWWDLADGAPYELKIEADISPRAVTWAVAE